MENRQLSKKTEYCFCPYQPGQKVNLRKVGTAWYLVGCVELNKGQPDNSLPLRCQQLKSKGVCPFIEKKQTIASEDEQLESEAV